MNLFVVAVNDPPTFSLGFARMYVWAVTNVDPIEFPHGARISAIEVFKFQEKLLTGGDNGQIKLWDKIDSVVPQNAGSVVKTFQNGSSTKVRSLLWILNTQYFVSAHQNNRVNVWRIDAEFEDLVDFETYGNIPTYLGYIENPLLPMITIGFENTDSSITVTS